MKIRRKRPTRLFFGQDTPDRPFWTPFLAEKVPNLNSKVLEKRLKNGQKEPFWSCSTFYRFSFARSSVYNSTLMSLTLLEWFHKTKKNVFFVAKMMVFLGTRDFLSPRPIWTFTAKKEARQISNYRANCDARVFFFFWNVWVKIRRNRPTRFFLSGHP